ncbi:hypothetical protein A2914_01665 [Candidatus Nomurabacteria bacterium RIFCSPLOWO2_01_FULL_41_21]|uniref:Uncharacterized protein n=2 Tax=Candidatus Nomuraibacteriota TaxID=1752729 RepID=A0A1F6V1Y2_9BACT|nr:MAG: hypothetical protein A2733_00575 [Candidatus Nomurabacteria bacterium RIFCSPHIGHO2_01_FULL_40_20]OGI88027.1 MAG: hypothetical protein A2914_01665 [Candidatus Nomurabacteria bacterium RIFCSPLOWO2_01_FULL_41_21]
MQTRTLSNLGIFAVPDKVTVTEEKVQKSYVDVHCKPGCGGATCRYFKREVNGFGSMCSKYMYNTGILDNSLLSRENCDGQFVIRRVLSFLESNIGRTVSLNGETMKLKSVSPTQLEHTKILSLFQKKLNGDDIGHTRHLFLDRIKIEERKKKIILHSAGYTLKILKG